MGLRTCVFSMFVCFVCFLCVSLFVVSVFSSFAYANNVFCLRVFIYCAFCMCFANIH